MLDGMRKASQGWLGRLVMAVIMGVIIVSFAIWGVGDIFRGFGGDRIAKVGDTEISADTFRNQYQTMLQGVQRQTRRAVTNEEARALGLDVQVLSRIIAEAALDQQVKSLGLAMSDAEIARLILADQTFAGPTGKFDVVRFQELLRDNGYTEQTFVREQRRVYLRQEIIDALTANLTVPASMLEAVHWYRDEVRSIDYVELPAAAAGDIPDPSAETLQSYFAARAQGYRAPEYRKLVLLSLTSTSVTDPASIPDADARKLYEQVKTQRFSTIETRAIEQVVFPDEKSAAAAQESITSGKTLAEAASAAGQTVVDLGTLARSQIFDPALGNAAFSLAENTVSAPVKGQFGYVLLRVTKINPATVKPFEEVAGDLKAEIATDLGKRKVQDLRDRIEDERTSGKPLDEAAKSAGLTVRTIDSVDNAGLDKNGAPVDLPVRDALLKAVFSSDIGVDNDTLNTPDGGYVWFEISGVERARDRTLDEVRDKVLAAWRGDETARKLTDRATELAKQINAGSSLDEIAKSLGNLEVKHIADVKREGAEGLSAAVVARVFAVPVGEAASAAADDQSRTLFKVLDSSVSVMDPDSDVTKGIANELRTSLSEDTITQYVGKLQTDVGVTVNQAAFNAAIGGADPNAY